jgi:DNA-formamidopyrimidine glycosylase
MPELPEVEALATFLREHAKGRVVARADAASFAALKTFDPPLSALAGRSIVDVGRHGKFLDLTASGPDGDLHLVFHLARAGWLRWREDIPDKPVKPGKSPLAFRLVFDDGAGFDLTEAGTQKRLAVYLVRDVAEVPGVATLGPEPLAGDFDVEALAAILKGRRTQIKGVLRDQHIIAGIGNAYSDEVLHTAKMSPFKLASSFTPDEVAALHAAIVTTLRDAVERSAGLAAADLKGEKKTGLRVHGKTGQPCPVCGDTIREVSFADSSLQYCPTCQTGGKPLADRRLSRLLKLSKPPGLLPRPPLGRDAQPPRPRVTAGTLNEVNLGALAQLEEHLLCKQRVRGSSPLSSTAGQRLVPILRTGLLYARTAAKYSSKAVPGAVPGTAPDATVAHSPGWYFAGSSAASRGRSAPPAGEGVSSSPGRLSASLVASEVASVYISIVTATRLCRRICMATRGWTPRAARSVQPDAAALLCQPGE